MKTIKKTTLIAAVTAMAALAVPVMASAAVWGPLNSNQSLDTNPLINPGVSYTGSGPGWPFHCSSQHLGVHVRTPASSVLDVTSASWTGCVGDGLAAGCPLTVAPTGLPWAATAVASTTISFSMHAQLNWGGACSSVVFNLDGSVGATWTPSTHTLTFPPGCCLDETYNGTHLSNLAVSGAFKNPTNILTLT